MDPLSNQLQFHHKQYIDRHLGYLTSVLVRYPRGVPVACPLGIKKGHYKNELLCEKMFLIFATWSEYEDYNFAADGASI